MFLLIHLASSLFPLLIYVFITCAFGYMFLHLIIPKVKYLRATCTNLQYISRFFLCPSFYVFNATADILLTHSYWK